MLSDDEKHGLELSQHEINAMVSKRLGALEEKVVVMV
jgi:hypothetical protein